MNVYFFGWPSDYGGADTKTAHLLRLLAPELNITVVPNKACQLSQTQWTSRLDQWGVAYKSMQDLPAALEGVGIGLCNGAFFDPHLYSIARGKGLKLIWSSEMMWHHPNEVDLIKAGAVDLLLYVSEVQKKALDYESFCDVPTRMTGNYIAPDLFPFKKRLHSQSLTIGRLSRADPLKYPENFPSFYEALELPDVKFRVMAWSQRLANKYRWHSFDERWDLLTENEENAVSFLQSLDLFVYTLGHEFTESWGRSTVEAMLTGAIPLVPDGHHFRSLVIDGETGFICKDFREFQTHAHQILDNPKLRLQLSEACREHAVQMNDAETHKQVWLEAIHAA